MKKILVLFLTVFAIFNISGCSLKHENKPQEITFWTLQMSDYSDYIIRVIQDYEQDHPNIHIKWVDVPFSEGEKRTLAAVMTDNPPDLINLNPDFSALLAQKGTLWKIDENKLSEFNPEIVNALRYETDVFSIPWYATSAITIYNKDLFKKSGLLRLPKTYKELASVSEKIKTNANVYSYLPTITENDTMIKILNKYGISEFDDFNSSISNSVFEMFQNLYKNDLIPPETVNFTHREALEQYMAGKLVFYQGGANFLNMIKENAPGVYANTDIMEQIKGPVGQNDFSVMNFVIPIKAKHKNEALDFCLYLTNENNQLELAKKTNIIATNSKALENDFYNDYSDLTSKARSISAKQINKITPIVKQHRGQKEINLLVNDTVQAILLNKGSTESLLNKLVKSLKELE